MVNKADLTEKWEVDEAALEELSQRGWPIFKTSAKTGAGVEEAFLAPLAEIDGPAEMTPREGLTPPPASATVPDPLFPQ